MTETPSVATVVRQYARIHNVDAATVLAAVEATLELLKQRQQVEGSTPIASPARADESVPTFTYADDNGYLVTIPAVPQPAVEPAPVPPPVDALLTLDQLRFAELLGVEEHEIERPDVSHG